MSEIDMRDVTGLYRKADDAYVCIICGRELPLRRSGMGRVSHGRAHVRDGSAVRLPGREFCAQPVRSRDPGQEAR